ncbi:hypothetical protein LXL04_023456 [Taraxacum kok-saghyz]
MSTEMIIKDIVEKERQISVDPVSMKETIDHYPRSGLPKPQKAKNPVHSKTNKFLSISLPNSACSSPRTVHHTIRAKNHDQSIERASPKYHQHSLAFSRLVWLPENHLQRSKSCGEGRPSLQYDEFDISTIKTSTFSASAESSPRSQTASDGDYKRIIEAKKRKDEDFKCGALCLFLPGFGKGKPVRGRRDQEREETRHVISRRVSLEKFECGSWRSSGMFNDDFSSNLYFDLPLELIQTSGNDDTLPVSSAFVFDKDVKGVLKNKGGGERKSNDCRHVRFSTSSGTTSPSSCITPRMRKAREEFSSYLEAQNA